MSNKYRYLSEAQRLRKQENARRYYAKRRMREAIDAGRTPVYSPLRTYTRALPIGLKLQLPTEHEMWEVAEKMGVLMTAQEKRNETEQLFDYFAALVQGNVKRGRPRRPGEPGEILVVPSAMLPELTAYIWPKEERHAR